MRYDLTDFEWRVIEPLKPIRHPSKSRIGASLVVSFRRVLGQRARRRLYSHPLKQVAPPKRGEVERQWRPERYRTLHERQRTRPVAAQ